MAAGIRWNREELLVAINVYEKLPFGQFDQRNPVVRDVAARMKRTPSSVAMKLCNLASLDPALALRGRKGLTGASELDREMWAEFQSDLKAFAPLSEDAFRRLFAAGETDEVDLVQGVGIRVRRHALSDAPTEREATVMVRRGQQFFRQMILNAFDNRCCVTGIAVRELLIASHILPWGGFPEARLDIQNGLCLSRLHDAAFDSGLISFDDDCCLVLSKELRGHLPQESLEKNFEAYAGRAITTAVVAFGPKREFLEHHRREIFRG